MKLVTIASFLAPIVGVIHASDAPVSGDYGNYGTTTFATVTRAKGGYAHVTISVPSGVATDCSIAFTETGYGTTYTSWVAASSLTRYTSYESTFNPYTMCGSTTTAAVYDAIMTPAADAAPAPAVTADQTVEDVDAVATTTTTCTKGQQATAAADIENTDAGNTDAETNSAPAWPFWMHRGGLFY